MPEVTLAIPISDCLFVYKKYRCIWTNYTAKVAGMGRKTREKQANPKLVLRKQAVPGKPEVSFSIKLQKFFRVMAGSFADSCIYIYEGADAFW